MKTEIYRIEMDCTANGKRTVINYKDRQFFQKGISTDVFPWSIPDMTKMTAFYLKGSQECAIEFKLEDWQTLVTGGKSALANSTIARLSDDFFAAEFPFPEVAQTSDGLDSLSHFPTMVMEDVTEAEFFNFHPINEGLLDDVQTGLWAFHGCRKFKFQVRDFPYNLHDTQGVTWKTGITLTKKDNEPLSEPINALNISIMDNEDKASRNYVMHAWLDTNFFGDEFKDSKQFYQFFGSLELTCRKEDAEFGPSHITNYSFPFSIMVHNTQYYLEEKLPCPRLDKNLVSIDFGTSSTCVAVQKDRDIELLTLSSEKLLSDDFKVLRQNQGGDINIYENPTNMMLFDWSTLYSQWKKENKDFAQLVQGTYDDSRDFHKAIDYDAGYTVTMALGSGDSDALKAILTQIKMVSYALEQGVQLSLSPYIKGDITNVKLVSSPQEQDDESLDPIAFYAYLLGRAINDPASKRIYTKFAVTYPVKFNQSVRAKLKASLEYGLKRSLPLPLREATDKKGKPLFEVIMDYSEPVAFVGSICGRELKASPGNPGLFAVYDFGGGTLDFAFGMFSVDEDDEGTIDIFGIDGDSDLGGEGLISRLSYWIYNHNKDIMAANLIPFIIPEDEQIPDDFPLKLLTNSAIAKANVLALDEHFSRPLFRNRDGKLDEDVSALANEAQSIELINENNEPVEMEIFLEYSVFVYNLTAFITKSVQNFKTTMESNFRNNESTVEAAGGTYDMDDVMIFKAGNSSRSVVVERAMECIFPINHGKENIKLIDQVAEGTQNKKYAITPKTAVAIGQLYMRNFTLAENNESPFAWNIYVESTGTATFTPVLEKNCKHRDWVYFGLMRRNEAEIFCATSIAESRDDPHFPLLIEGDEESEDWKKAYLYLRVHNESAVEYFISETKEAPDNSLAVNQEHILEIQEPNLG